MREFQTLLAALHANQLFRVMLSCFLGIILVSGSLGKHVLSKYFIKTMVSTSIPYVDASQSINIQDYVLEKFVPAKVVEATLKLSYLEASADQSNQPTTASPHAQLKCPQVIYPFARNDATVSEVPIIAAQQLVEVDEELAIKAVLELTLKSGLPNNTSYYQPGDSIAILPRNKLQHVEALLAALNLTNKAHCDFQLQLAPNCTKKSAKLPTYIPVVTTPYEVLRDCLNLNAVPKKQFLSTLASCCGNSDERAFLSCLSSKEASSHYNALILERGLTLLELLQLCPSCQPTLEMLIEYLPRLLPRAYSIANSPHTNASKIKIIFSILTTKPGVTTSMLHQLAKPLLEEELNTSATLPKIAIYFRQYNSFRFTAEIATENNHILIGVGTALAPFLGFLEYKQHLVSSNKQALGETWLFAGAATEACIPHRERVLELQSEGVLQQYFECCSRVPNARFRYVQDQLLAHAKELVELLLREQTVLFVCADGGQISKSIEKSLCECLMLALQLPETEAIEMLKEYRGNGKYREDVWT